MICPQKAGRTKKDKPLAKGQGKTLFPGKKGRACHFFRNTSHQSGSIYSIKPSQTFFSCFFNRRVTPCPKRLSPFCFAHKKTGLASTKAGF
jgi:hypothetical protein